MAVMTPVAIGIIAFVPAAGIPTCRMSFQDLTSSSRSGFLNVSKSSRLCIRYKVPANITPRAISAAIAAPLSPIAGTGPMPKMRIGSSMTLMIAVTTMSILGSLVSPVARMLLMPTIPTTTNGTPTYRIFMYPAISGISSSGAPSNRNKGVIVAIPTAQITTVIPNDSNRLSVERRLARR